MIAGNGVVWGFLSNFQKGVNHQKISHRKTNDFVL